GLTTLTDFTARRRARRAALGDVLTVLLEVRHRLIALYNMRSLLNRFPPQHRAAWLKVLPVFEDMLPNIDGLTDIYASALTVLSKESPVIAFQLRFKDRPINQI